MVFLQFWTRYQQTKGQKMDQKLKPSVRRLHVQFCHTLLRLNEQSSPMIRATLPQRIVIREFCKSREKGKLSLLHILYYFSWWLSSVEFRNVPGLDAVSVHVCIFIKTERKSGPKWWILIIMIITILIIILKIDS